MSLGQKDFSGGWQPSASFINGPKNCCLRMDNVSLEEIGSLTLNRGAIDAIPDILPAAPKQLFSQYISGSKYRYVGCTNGVVIRNGGQIGNSKIGQFAFGAGFGEIFISSGITFKLKDSGSVTKPWGLNAPGAAPSVVVNTPPFVNWVAPASYTGFTALEGSLGTHISGNVQVTTDTITNRAILQYVGAVNLTVFSDGGMAEDQDLFSVNILVPDSNQVVSVRVEALLQTPGAGVSDTTDYYYYEWDAATSASFVAGVNQWSTLNAMRIDFQRQGNTQGLDWSSVKAVRIIYLLNPPLSAGSSTTCQLGVPFSYTGGSKGQLYGGTGTSFSPYTYFQVNVYNSGAYLGASPISAVTQAITAIATSTTLTPYITGIDSQVNEIWFYRQGGTLESPYFIGKSILVAGVFPSVVDSMSDIGAERINIIANTFLASILTQIIDPVIAIEGPCNGRMVLMTQKNLIFTDYLNPESYDSRMVLTLSGAVGEINLFCTRIGGATLLVGTTEDIYQVTGTFQQLPDGTFDVTITALGLDQPPINPSFAIKDYTLYFVAQDGIKGLAFSLSNTISGTLQTLWRGETRYGVPGLSTEQSYNQQQLTYYKGRLSGIFQHVDGTASIIEYDLAVTKSWNRRPIPGTPTVIYTEPDGDVLLGTGENDVKQFDVGSQFDGQNMSMNIQLPCLDGETPYSRKDLFTLKVIFNGGPIDVYLLNENGVSFLAGSNLSSNGDIITNLSITGCPIDLSKQYALAIQDHANDGISNFSLNEWWLDYVARPPQECFNYVIPINLGSPSRKRFLQYAIVVDTLDKDCIFTPIVDDTPQPPLLINTTINKATVVYTFKNEVIGVEIGHTITPVVANGVIEYYGVATEECISEKMPPLSTYLVIPQNNFGTPSKKRVRTLPMVINTFSENVSFQPIVDGVVQGAPQIFNTAMKKTVYYYFTNDSFGTDYGGVLQYAGGTFLGTDTPLAYGQGQFEFYGLLTPETVEELPVPKLYDQFGPYQLDRRGQLYEFRCRILSFTSTINYAVIMDDVTLVTGFFVTKIGVDTVYDIRVPKGMIGAVMRVEISSPDTATAFYCWYSQFSVVELGMPSGRKWITISGKVTK